LIVSPLLRLPEPGETRAFQSVSGGQGKRGGNSGAAFKDHPVLLCLSGCCSETEVSEQLYCLDPVNNFPPHADDILFRGEFSKTRLVLENSKVKLTKFFGIFGGFAHFQD
jgi:hypothetical protein